MTRRDDKFDIAKGIGILCVILGHLAWEGVCYRIVYPFHMPLFFLISGWFLNGKMTPKKYLIDRSRRLLPAYLFSVACILFVTAVLFLLKVDYSPLVPTKPTTILIRALYASGSIHNKTPLGIGSIGAIWFLPALLLSTSFVRLIVFRFHRKAIQMLLIVGLFGVSVLTSRWFWLPISLQSAGSASVYVYIGWLIRYYSRLEYGKTIQKYKPLICMLGIILLAFEFYFFLYVEIARAYFPLTLTTVICSVIICFSILILSSYLANQHLINRVLTYFGRYSLVIMSAHSILRFFIVEDVYETVIHYEALYPVKYLIVFVLHLSFSIAFTVAVNKIEPLKRVFFVNEMSVIS